MDQKRIGRFIASARREKGMTQRQLAEALGLSNRTVSKWECGDGLPVFFVHTHYPLFKTRAGRGAVFSRSSVWRL